MGAYDGDKVCELVGLFLLNNLANNFDKNSVGLYRNAWLASFKIINSNWADKTCKEFHKLFKENKLFLDIECNLKYVNYLDITLDTGLTNHIANLMMKYFISTLNPIILQIF